MRMVAVRRFQLSAHPPDRNNRSGQPLLTARTGSAPSAFRPAPLPIGSRRDLMGYQDYDRFGRDRNYGYRTGDERGPGNRDREDRWESRGRSWREEDRYDRDRDDRGFFERAGDELRSWFGDEEDERRRRQDERN